MYQPLPSHIYCLRPSCRYRVAEFLLKIMPKRQCRCFLSSAERPGVTFHFLSGKLYFSGHTVAVTCPVCILSLSSSTDAPSTTTHPALMQFHIEAQCSRKTLNHFRDTVEKRADVTQVAFQQLPSPLLYEDN